MTFISTSHTVAMILLFKSLRHMTTAIASHKAPSIHFHCWFVFLMWLCEMLILLVEILCLFLFLFLLLSFQTSLFPTLEEDKFSFDVTLGFGSLFFKPLLPLLPLIFNLYPPWYPLAVFSISLSLKYALRLSCL